MTYLLFQIRGVRPYESVYRDRIPLDFAGPPEMGLMPKRKYQRSIDGKINEGCVEILQGGLGVSFNRSA